jgi:hypothetical protein
VPDELSFGIRSQHFVEIRITSVIWEFAGIVWKVLDVHHQWNVHFCAKVIDTVHLWRIQRQMIFQLTDADGTFLNRFPHHFDTVSLRWIGAHGPYKDTWPFRYLFLCFLFIACTGKENGIRRAAALHVREARIGILTKMQVRI